MSQPPVKAGSTEGITGSRKKGRERGWRATYSAGSSVFCVMGGRDRDVQHREDPSELKERTRPNRAAKSSPRRDPTPPRLCCGAQVHRVRCAIAFQFARACEAGPALKVAGRVCARPLCRGVVVLAQRAEWESTRGVNVARGERVSAGKGGDGPPDAAVMTWATLARLVEKLAERG